LEISRLQQAKLVILAEDCEMAPILARALGTIRPLAEAAEVQLQCTQDPDDLHLRTNGDKLAEVLVNILENGVRYSPQGGVLEVGAVVEKDRVVLKVRDHGPGFQGIADPFARFVQGQPSPHDQGGGYGLGLAIAQEYTRLMGGEISARNHPTGGAEFVLVLPPAGSAIEGN
jgi:signal transduction histidine kinase